MRDGDQKPLDSPEEIAVVFLGHSRKILLGLVPREEDGRAVAEGWWRLKLEKDKEQPSGVVVLVPCVRNELDFSVVIRGFDGEDWSYRLSPAEASRAARYSTSY